LAIAVCGVPVVKKELIARAVSDATRFGLDVRVVDISNSYTGDFVLAVREQLASSSLSGPLSLMLIGIDSLIYATDEVINGGSARPTFVTRFNFDRERIASQLPYPTVLWMESEAFRLLLREAPDLSQWVSARFDFGTLPERGLYFLHALMQLDKLGPPEFAHLDLASEEALVREIEGSTARSDHIAMGRRILLLIMLGQQHLMSAKTVEARKTIREAVRLAKRFRSKRLEAAGLEVVAGIDLTEGKTKPAIRELRTVTKLFQQAGDNANAASATLHLARAYIADGDYRAATLCLRRITENSVGGGATRLDAFVELGTLHAEAGEKEKAEDVFEVAISLMDGTHDPRANLARLMRMGESLRNTDPKRALDLFERCLLTARRVADRRAEAHCLAGIGLTYEGMGEYRRAISYLEESWAIFSQLGDRAARTRILLVFVVALARVEDLDRAESLARESLDSARKAADRRNEALSLIAIGASAEYKGEVLRAREAARAGAQILRETGDPALKVFQEWLATLEKAKLPPQAGAQSRPSAPGLSGISRP